MSTHHGAQARIPRLIRMLAIPIAIFWLALAASSNALVPPLEEVGRVHNVAENPKDAPSLIATKRVGKVFGEYDSDSLATIVIEGDQPLGAEAHRFYDTLVQRLSHDTAHVQHVQDFWGDPLTAAGSQSSDGKAALVQIYLVGDAGGSTANASVKAVRGIVSGTPAPPGIRAYVSGPAPLIADQFAADHAGMTFFIWSRIVFTDAGISLIEKEVVAPSMPLDARPMRSRSRYRIETSSIAAWASP